MGEKKNFFLIAELSSSFLLPMSTITIKNKRKTQELTSEWRDAIADLTPLWPLQKMLYTLIEILHPGEQS